MALMDETDMMNVTCDSDNGPLGNRVSSFWRSTKLTVAQPFDAPADAISKFPAKNQSMYEARKNERIKRNLTEKGRTNLTAQRSFRIHGDYGE